MIPYLISVDILTCDKMFYRRFYDTFFPVNQPPEFVEVPDAIEIMEGETGEFECKVKGKPLPDIQWYRDIPRRKDEDLENVQNLPNEVNSEVDSKAWLDKVQLSDEGTYKVKATNSAGSVKCEIPVTGK